MNFLDAFNSEKISIAIQSIQSVMVNYQSTDTWATLTTADGIFYRGSIANRFVDDRIRAGIAGVILFDPDDLAVDIDQDMRAVIDSKYYYFTEPDNVVELDDVILVAVKHGEA